MASWYTKTIVAALIGLSVSSNTSAVATTASTMPPPVMMAAVPRSLPDFKPQMLYATGEGAMPSVKEQPNRAKAYLQAKAYAKMQAIASLVQEAKGTVVSYCSEGRNYSAQTLIKQEIKGVLDCVQVVSAKKRAEGKDTIVEVTVRAPKPVPPKQLEDTDEVKRTTAKAWKAPSWTEAKAAASASAASGGYTSVIIDATGLRLARSMSPKILRPDGSEVWGTVSVDPGFLTEYGIAAYARNHGEALANRRAGGNPLVMRARQRGDSPARCDVVISDSDADRLLDADARSGFLGEFRVIVIVSR